MFPVIFHYSKLSGAVYILCFQKKLVKIRANKIIAGYVQRQRVMVDLSGYVRPRYIVCGVHYVDQIKFVHLGDFVKSVHMFFKQGLSDF